MWVVLVDGVYTNWSGHRNILHFTSDDGVYLEIHFHGPTLLHPRVIDPTVYRVGEMWYMVYKDETRGSHTFVSQSSDLENWSNGHQAGSTTAAKEAPFAFRWKDKWWLIVDGPGLAHLHLHQRHRQLAIQHHHPRPARRHTAHRTARRGPSPRHRHFKVRPTTSSVWFIISPSAAHFASCNWPNWNLAPTASPFAITGNNYAAAPPTEGKNEPPALRIPQQVLTPPNGFPNRLTVQKTQCLRAS